MISQFSKLTKEMYQLAGGKGRILAQLYQAGYPVPNGFVILSTAFKEGGLNMDVWQEIEAALAHLRKDSVAFAVRSSALNEDSEQASFAGEFESVLNVKTDQAIKKAIQTVYESRQSARVEAYYQAQNIEVSQEIAVVIQKMVTATISGVLFTANPVTGSRVNMVGNFVNGLGDRLVSGEVNPHSFTLQQPKGAYAGPPELASFANTLFRLAKRLEIEFGKPQDIEWAIANDNVYLLQTRPITNLQGYNLITGEVNDSLTGDYLWTRANVGEAISNVMTPYTWSVLDYAFNKSMKDIVPMPQGNYTAFGNIGGRLYQNLTLGNSMGAAFGKKDIKRSRMAEGTAGQIPKEVEIPIIPFNRWDLLRKTILPAIPKMFRTLIKIKKDLPNFIKKAPALYQKLEQQIYTTQTPQALIDIWHQELAPLLKESFIINIGAINSLRRPHVKLQADLEKLLDPVTANALFAGFNQGVAELKNSLASLGPVLGLYHLAQGNIKREEYIQLYGHRGPYEFEFSIPRPAENPIWIDQQIAAIANSNIDLKAMLSQQKTAYTAALQKLETQHPKQAKSIRKRLKTVAKAAHLREASRSEWTRLVGLMRVFACQAMKMLNLGDDIFFLSLSEILIALTGDISALQYIPTRKKTHALYCSLPPYPVIINGRFDPFVWANAPNHRGDIFDAHSQFTAPENGTITGFPGSAGIVEGTVCVINAPNEGHNLQTGQILVTTTTNVGWTPLFPRSAAIITDVGAPLSHAAIVARELGIPAVVGCGNATTRLRTGDRVRVNGIQGSVEILST